MSEQPVTAPKRENVLTHRLGALPTWVWIAIGGGLILLWTVYKGRTQPSSQTTATSATPADQVPQFVNQTFTTVSPPSTTINITDQDAAQHKHPKPPGKRPPPPKDREERGVTDVRLGGGRTRKGRIDTYLSTGTLSANTLAKQWHEPVETILQTSTAHNDSDALESYIREHNWNKKLPKGVRLYIPED